MPAAYHGTWANEQRSAMGGIPRAPLFNLSSDNPSAALLRAGLANFTNMDEIIPGIYEHYRGNRYLVIGTAAHSETMERLVVYITLYDSPGPRMWVRPCSMFAQVVQVDGRSIPRFRYIGQEIPTA